MSPQDAQATREEQRRRILFALEAPLPSVGADLSDSEPVPRLSLAERRKNSLQRRLWAETDPQRRMDIREELIALSRGED